MKISSAWLLILLTLASVDCAEGQQSAVYRVGILTLGRGDIPELKGLRDGLKEAGYVEGKNLLLEIAAKESYDELRPIAKAYTERKLNVIVASGGSAPLIAKESTKDIPIVFVGGGDPIQAGLVKSIARPEANLTGVSRLGDVEIYGKRLQVFKEAVPILRKVSVLYNARGENPIHEKSLTLVQNIAPALGLKIDKKPIKTASDLDQTLSSISKHTTDGLFLICATIFRVSSKKVASAAIQKRLALMGCGPTNVTEQGALLFYGADTYRIGHRSAWYVDRILQGTKPQDLPVESPTYFEFIINLTTAKQIGLTIPPNVLARADRVIK